jgi:hypothetical protein
MSVLAEDDLVQRFTALGDGNEIRMQRAAMRRRLKEQGRPGAAVAARILNANPDLIHTLDIGEFLLWVPYFGKTKAKRVLEGLKLSPWCEIDEMAAWKRRELVRVLTAFGEGKPARRRQR